MRNELPVEIEHPEEAAEFLECFGHRKVFAVADFRWGRADALIINDVAQEFYLRCAEDTRFLLTANRASIQRTRTTQDIIRERYCFTNCNIQASGITLPWFKNKLQCREREQSDVTAHVPR